MTVWRGVVSIESIVTDPAAGLGMESLKGINDGDDSENRPSVSSRAC